MFLCILSFGTLPLRLLFGSLSFDYSNELRFQILNIYVRMVASDSFASMSVFSSDKSIYCFEFCIFPSLFECEETHQLIKELSTSPTPLYRNHRPSVGCGHFVICFAR